jgi:hypothetical protein
MSMILVPSRGPEDWQRLLAEPERQWRDGYSAKRLAECWESAQGFPEAVRQAFERSGIEALAEIEPLLVLPEYQTSLPGGRRPSQTDVFVLAKARGGLVAIAVEGKVEEPFGPTVGEWKAEPTPGKAERLRFLCDVLGLCADAVGSLRYQLLHRTASAILEAQRFTARHAVMLVHSFSPSGTWYEDFEAFLGVLGRQAARETVTQVGKRSEVELYCGWVSGEAG